MPNTLTCALRLATPLLAAAGAIAAARYLIAPGIDLESMSRGLAGPGTWPKAMLYGVAICAFAIFLRNLASLRSDSVAEGADHAADAGTDDAKLLSGIALLIGYAFAITTIGFAFATLAFIAAWLVLSGLRRPLTVALVSTLGTAAILYLFVRVSSMPLDRGVGAFEAATISVYRMLGIY